VPRLSSSPPPGPGTPADAAGAGGRRARRVRAVNGAGAGAVPRHLRPYFPAADYRKIRELVCELAGAGGGGGKWQKTEWNEKGVESGHPSSPEKHEGCAIRCMRQHGHSLARGRPNTAHFAGSAGRWEGPPKGAAPFNAPAPLPDMPYAIAHRRAHGRHLPPNGPESSARPARGARPAATGGAEGRPNIAHLAGSAGRAQWRRPF
jgi:hypothetical protein